MTVAPGRRVNRVRVLLAALVGSLVLAELALRLLGLPAQSFAFLGELEAERYQSDPEVLWRLRPDAPGLLVNRLGLRGWLPAGAKRARDLRLCCVGDSCTFGAGVEYEEGYGIQLERLLQRELPERCVETVLAALPGFSTYQSRRLLTKHIDELQPDVTILYCGVWNDYVVAVGASDAEQGRRQAAGVLDLRLARLLDRALAPARSREEYLQMFRAGVPPEGRRVPLAEFRDHVRALIRTARSKGSAVVVMLPAWPQTTINEFPIGLEYRAALGEVAGIEGAIVVDPLAAMRAREERCLQGGAPGPLSPCYIDWIHPGPVGHRVLAEQLLPAVRALAARGSSETAGLPQAPRVDAAVPPSLPALARSSTVTLTGSGFAEPGAFDRVWIVERWIPSPRVLGPDRLEVPLPEDLPPGSHEIELVTARGLRRTGCTVTVTPPLLSAEARRVAAGVLVKATCEGPPGAVVVAWAGGLRETALPTWAGAWWLAGDLPGPPADIPGVKVAFERLGLPKLSASVGETGRANLDGTLEIAGPVHLQALVAVERGGQVRAALTDPVSLTVLR